MPYNGPASQQALNEFMAKNKKLPQHYWVSSRHGLAFNVATIPINPGRKRNSKKRFKYLGFTFDENFPKKLHNGRTLYEDKKGKLPVTSKN